MQFFAPMLYYRIIYLFYSNQFFYIITVFPHDNCTTHKCNHCHSEKRINTKNSEMEVDRSKHQPASKQCSKSMPLFSENEQEAGDEFKNSDSQSSHWFHSEFCKQCYWLWMCRKFEEECLSHDERRDDSERSVSNFCSIHWWIIIKYIQELYGLQQCFQAKNEFSYKKEKELTQALFRFFQDIQGHNRDALSWQ